MRRREFIAGLSSVAAWPVAARAQQRTMPVIGYLGAPPQRQGPNYANVAAFRAGLAETGYVEGRNVAIEIWSVEGQFDRYPALAEDLVRRGVAMIFAGSTPATLAAKAATTTIPIVFAIGADPVFDGVVASLNRPGTNVTGASYFALELIGKRMELLHEIVPAAATIGHLLNPTGGIPEAETKDAENAARALGVQLAILNASTESQIETAFATLAERRIGALTIGFDGFFFSQHEQLVRLAAHHRIPVISAYREFVDAGGLMSYGANTAAAFRLAGTYASRILSGEKPADLPVQRSTKIELIINLKTAKALGLTIRPNLLAVADEVIE
jgi:putative ABC transport system substrate-binding protein